jgi:hypothetical protein
MGYYSCEVGGETELHYPDLNRAGLCLMHNTDEAPPAAYLACFTPSGNVLPVCVECAAWLRASDEPPRWVRDLR